MALTDLIRKEGETIRKQQEALAKRLKAHTLNIRKAIQEAIDANTTAANGKPVFLSVDADGDAYCAKVSGENGRNTVDITWSSGDAARVKHSQVINILTEEEYTVMFDAEIAESLADAEAPAAEASTDAPAAE